MVRHVAWLVAVVGCVVLSSIAGCGKGEERVAPTISIWYAQWAPADALQELGNQYETETGIKVEVVQIPWDSFQDMVFREFASTRTGFDIVVGDSQWLGRGAEKGLYVDLTDWLPTAVDLGVIHPVVLSALCQYEGRYYAAPCEPDACGFAYRKDWFEDPGERAAFKTRYGRELAPPDTWEEFRQVAAFFTRPDQARYGCALLAGRKYDSLVMGFQQLMWAWGGDWSDPQTHRADGYVNCPASVEALTFYRDLVRDCAPPGAVNFSYEECTNNLNNGRVAMAMIYFGFYPGFVNVLGDKVGFFMTPARGDERVASLGGQGFSISTKTDEQKQEMAKRFIAWFLARAQQEKWTRYPGAFTAHAGVLASEEFQTEGDYNAAFADSLDYLKDFYSIPEYSELLAAATEHVAEALDGARTPKEALDAIAEAHENILREAGLLKE